jgi:hypothetical protein
MVPTGIEFIAMKGRYRLRTYFREHSPDRIAMLIPKGAHDCGNHEWYLDQPQTWRCYHCEVGLTNEVPWGEREFIARRLEGQAMNARAGWTAVDHESVHVRD